MAARAGVRDGERAVATDGGRPVPRLSVVMPVHNAAPYLDASIGSILGQTFEDFELVVLDDASTDGSAARLLAWAARDPRVRVVRSEARLGIVRSADRVVREARAPVCARMDADDVSRPGRLAAQWAVLEANPDASLVGTLWEGIDAAGRLVRPRDRWRLVRRSSFAPFPHGSIMFRRDAFEAAGGYRSVCAYWEDLDLYLRMAAHGRILVLPVALYRYRFHATSLLGGEIRMDEEHAAELMLRCLAARRASGDYAPLLAAAAGGDNRASLSPSALYLLASRRLWAGHRPGILRRLPAVRPRRPTPFWLGLLALGTVGDLAPRALRAALYGFVHLRDALAGIAIRDGKAVEWRFE
jgi:glycosyltransferase involved in cell wall biosynthesis